MLPEMCAVIFCPLSELEKYKSNVQERGRFYKFSMSLFEDSMCTQNETEYSQYFCYYECKSRISRGSY